MPPDALEPRHGRLGEILCPVGFTATWGQLLVRNPPARARSPLTPHVFRSFATVTAGANVTPWSVDLRTWIVCGLLVTLQVPLGDWLSYDPISVKVDDRDQYQPGYKFNEWEVKGVPVRVELGPKDLAKNACVLARRDVPGKEGKEMGVPLAGAAARIGELLQAMQTGLLEKARRFRERNALFAAFHRLLIGGGGAPLRRPHALAGEPAGALRRPFCR